MKKNQIFLATAILGLAISFTSCDKSNEVLEQDATEKTNMTLVEYVEARDDAAATDFILNTTPTDNSMYTARAFANGDRAVGPVFPWDVSIGDGCWGCFGWCNSDPTDPTHEPFGFPIPWPEISSNSVGGVFSAEAGDKKLAIYPRPEVCDCAFTEDGYFPMSAPLDLSDNACDVLGLPLGTHIPAGVYVASFDEEAGAYRSVILDLVY